MIDLTTYALPDDGAPKIVTVRTAWSIDDAVPPKVVGDADALSECICPPEAENSATTLGFSALLDGNNLIKELLPVDAGPNCDHSSGARDIDQIIVGLSGDDIGGFCVGDQSKCQVSKDGVVLLEGSSASALTDYSAGASEARGTNTDENIVGWGFENINTPCQMSAAFWVDSLASPFNLGTVSGITPGDESRAEAMSNPDIGGDLMVVGKNETLDHALLWQGSGASWTVTDLTTVIINQCAGIEDLIPVEAHDVNDDGWIVGWADADPSELILAHAFLLVPSETCQVCCFGDLDCSGDVGTNDLLLLFADWGPCVGCAADLDCNGIVSTSDLNTLFANWGSCAQNAGGGGGSSLQQAVQVVGFANVDACCAWLGTATENEAFVCGQVILAVLENQQ